MKILLKGYYGFGNLGDDILLKVTYEFVRKIFPQAKIMVFSNESTGYHRYLKKLLYPDVTILNSASREHVDFIIHGGGGVHYDFNEGRTLFWILNTAIKVIGIDNYCRLYTIFKKLRSKGNVTTSFRVGLGIGVGIYTASSEKFYTSISILGSYQYLLVRDSSSVLKARMYNQKGIIKQATDLAFMRDEWTTLQKRVTNGERRIGIVLRDWKREQTHLASLKELASVWTEQGYHVSFFFFEENQDLVLRNSLEGVATCIVWNPHSQSIDDFLASFFQQSVIITSRFHGSILAAAFGIPSLCLAIEPKLQTIQEMMPSVKIITLPIDEPALIETVEEIFSNHVQISETILKEFNQNKIRIQSDLNEVENVLRSHVESTKTGT